jgi:uncharacterized membrane protein
MGDQEDKGVRGGGLSSGYLHTLKRLSRIPAVLYLLLTIPSGVLLILFDKRPSWPDSAAHWLRILQISRGGFLSQPNPDGSGAYGGFDATGKFSNFNNSAINSPFVYFPSVLAHGHVRLASLLTLVVCSSIIAAAIYLSRQYQYAFLGIALLPIVFLSICYPTPDGVTNSVSLLFVAFVLRLLQNEAPPDTVSVVVLVILSALLGFIKITCVTLVLLVWVLPLRFKGIHRKSTWLPCVFSTLAALISTAVWTKMTSRIPPSAVVDLPGFASGKARILSHPMLMIRSVLVTLFQPPNTTGDPYDLARNIQLFTGYGPTLSATIMVPLLVAVMILILMSCNVDFCAGAWSKIVVAVIIALFFCVTAAGLMSSWGTPNLGRYVGGIQSRYYVPIYALLVLLVPSVRVSFSRKREGSIFLGAMIVWGYLGILIAHCIPFL